MGDRMCGDSSAVRGGEPVEDAGEGARVPWGGFLPAATELPRSTAQGSGLRLKRRESRPDVNAAGCRGEDEDGDARLDSAI